MLYILQGENIIERHRNIMGKTDPKKAAKDTVRALYGKNIMQNSIHGSDSLESAKKEIKLFENIF